MEDKFQLRASLGSKLPKFGASKPVGSFLQRAQNGTYNGISAKGNFSADKHMEHDRTSAFSVNWNQPRYPQNDQISRAPPSLTIERTPQVMVQNDAHRLGVSKPGKQSNMLVSHKEDLSDNVLSSSTKFTKGSQFGRTPYPGSSAHKPQSNGFYSAKPPTGLYRPRANSATSRNFTNNVLSSDNKPFPHVRRSQSFSHSLQNSKYPTTGLTRSYSLHRETDMAKILQSQHLPTRTELKSRTAKQYGLSNGNEPHVKSMFTRTGYSTGFTSGLKKPVFTNGPVASVPLGYKLTRPSLQKANRPAYPRDLIPDGIKGSSVTPVNHKIELVSNGTCQATDPLHKGEGKDSDVDNFSSCNNLERQDFTDSYFGDDVDELSISSLSSSDKNDFSEDFSDDFLDLEDGSTKIIVEKPEKTFPETPSQHLLAEPDEKQIISNNTDEWLDMNLSDLEDGNKTLSDEKLDKDLPEEPLYSLGDLHARNKRNSNNSDDWIDMNLSVQNEADTKSHSYAENGVSPDMDYRDPSSLELSPSDSSDGTYMWDEEGMEPIGNVHRCESYESSEMNSLDILNNIETCDLEEDDLMLDVEIPEDPPCDPGEGENMSRFDRSERNLRQQKLFWKRNPPRLNGQEQYHLSNPEHYHNGRGSSCLESPSDQKDNYGSPYCSPLSPRSPQAIGLQENTVMLDEMTLRHMVQDCTTVKTQLLKLKRLLQQEDDPESPIQDLQLCIPTTIEQMEAETHLKTEDLLTEIQQLKEESRKKDDMIKQLQEQLKTRCKCQRETPEPKVEKLKQHDKFTQTSCRRNSPQILQCSSSTLTSTDHLSGKLTACQPTGVPNEPGEQIQESLPFCQSEDSGASAIIPASYLSDLLSTRLKINDGEDNPTNEKEQQDKSHTQFDENKNVRLCSGDLASPSSQSQQKDVKSKTSVNASLPGQVSSPKTLQSPKPKLQYSLAHRGNRSASPNSSSTLTDFKVLINSSGPSLQQENLHTKKKPTIPSTYPVHQTNVNASSDSNTKMCSPAGQSLLTKTMLDARHLIHNSSSTTDKLSSEGELATHQRAQATEPSKPVSKLMPKGSLLRPPSNLPSKLKTPNISKPDMLSQDVPKEAQKPPGKASSIVPRHTSHKKDGMREGDTCSIPKRQSRLPQPKSH